MHEEAAGFLDIGPYYELWPENLTAFNVFVALESQWRMLVGFASVTYQGIDYSVIEPVLRLMGLKKKEWPAIFRDLRVMESAAKNVFNEKRSD